ncbi:MAG: hypothetical protein IJ281_09985 [Clostridia bacterium]|nr:hypothetical protein [Clostridia bacterium]
MSYLPGASLAGLAYQEVEAALYPLNGMRVTDTAGGQVHNDNGSAVDSVNLIEFEGNSPHVQTGFVFFIVLVVVNPLVDNAGVQSVLLVGGTYAVDTVNQLGGIALSAVLVFVELGVIQVSVGNPGSGLHYVHFLSSESGRKRGYSQQSNESNCQKFLCVHENSP